MKKESSNQHHLRPDLEQQREKSAIGRGGGRQQTRERGSDFIQLYLRGAGNRGEVAEEDRDDDDRSNDGL
jgi:hypothetical protein